MTDQERNFYTHKNTGIDVLEKAKQTIQKLLIWADVEPQDWKQYYQFIDEEINKHKMKNMRLKVQCTDNKGIRGSFVVEHGAGKQVTPTFVDCHELFRSREYQAIKDFVDLTKHDA